MRVNAKMEISSPELFSPIRATVNFFFLLLCWLECIPIATRELQLIFNATGDMLLSEINLRFCIELKRNEFRNITPFLNHLNAVLITNIHTQP